MKYLRMIAVALMIVLTLSACQTTPVPVSPEVSSSAVTESDGKENTGEAEDEVTEEPVEDTTEDTLSEEETEGMVENMQQSGPKVGYYIASSVMVEGDLEFFGVLEATNGYLLLNEDNTGTMLFDGVEESLTWDDEAIYWCDKTLPCLTISYYDPELGKDDGMVMVYFLEEETSICFRPAAE